MTQARNTPDSNRNDNLSVVQGGKTGKTKEESRRLLHLLLEEAKVTGELPFPPVEALITGAGSEQKSPYRFLHLEELELEEKVNRHQRFLHLMQFITQHAQETGELPFPAFEQFLLNP